MTERNSFHCGYAVMIGRPNVGKSTLMNRLIGEKIAITSEKPQTTRHRIQTVLTMPAGQIIFLDTPGVVRKSSHKLTDYMLDVSYAALADADVVLWLVEPDSHIGPGDLEIAEKLKQFKQTTFLLINKIDTVRKEQLLAVIENYRKLYPFSEIIPISAKTGEGTDDLLASLVVALPEGPALFDEDHLTDQNVREICAELIREKALRLLDKEIPHGIAVVIDSFDETDAALTRIDATIICEKESHKGIIIGRQGAMLKKIGSVARQEMERLLDGKVFLSLHVKVKKNWRDKTSILYDLGYQRRKG